MRTLRCVGWPSSSTLSEPRRLPMVPSSTTVQSSLATFWSDPAAEGGDALAVEVGLEAVADGLVEQDAGPAGAEDDGHLAGGRFHAIEHDDGFARGLVGELLGRFVVEEVIEVDAPPPPECPRCGGPPAWRARAETLRRASGWRSRERRPSLVATITWRRLSA